MSADPAVPNGEPEDPRVLAAQAAAWLVFRHHPGDWREALPRAVSKALEVYGAHDARLTAERDALARWKAEALPVLAEWDEVYVALGEPGALGESKARASRAEVTRLREALAASLGHCKTWHGDCCPCDRGPGGDDFCTEGATVDEIVAALTPPTDQGEGATRPQAPPRLDPSTSAFGNPWGAGPRPTDQGEPDRG